MNNKYGLCVWMQMVDRCLCSGSINWHGMQDLVKQLQRPMQMHLDPAGRLLNWLPWIIRSPALDKAQSQYAKTSQIIDSNASSSRNAYNELANKSINSNTMIQWLNSLLPAPPICWLDTPATAAACAAAAACALVASECICWWHWRKSKTCTQRAEGHPVRVQDLL